MTQHRVLGAGDLDELDLGATSQVPRDRAGPFQRRDPVLGAVHDQDPATRQVWRDHTEIFLSAKEFAILETFMRRPGDVLSRYQLLEHAWDYEYENRSNVVDVYVRYLREKVDRPFHKQSIETVRGAGYRLRKPEPVGERS